MAEAIERLQNDVVHLVRLALTGRPQDVQSIVRKMARGQRDAMPDLSERLTTLLRELPSQQAPLRSAAGDPAPVPVDLDTRVQLVRVELEPEPDVEPVYPAGLAAELEGLISERQAAASLEAAGLNPTRTVLFTGPPGTGKTMTARWVAKRLDVPLLTLDLSAVMSSFLGRTGANLRQVLDYAKRTPSVLLLDEFDAVAKRRDDDAEIGELKRLVTVLLQEVDDWPPGNLLLAATNHPELLDPAAWRRFEAVLEFAPLPQEHMESLVKAVLGRFAAPEGAAAGTSYAVPAVSRLLAQLWAGRSPSDARRALDRSLRNAVVHGLDPLDQVVTAAGAEVGRLPRSQRGDAAAQLVLAGLGQRQVHEITGVSRDAIRRATGSAADAPASTDDDAAGTADQKTLRKPRRRKARQ